MRIALIVLGVLVLLLFIFFPAGKNPNPSPSNGQEANQSFKPSANQAAQHTNTEYLLGLGYVTANRSIVLDQAYSKIAQVAHVAYIQRTWKQWLNDKSVTADDINIARSKGLKIYLAFEALNNLRLGWDLPDGLKGDFSSEIVKQAYLAEVVKIAQNYKPDYFIVNVEPVLYRTHNQKDYENFINFYPQVYQAVKNASPQTQVGVSVVYNESDSTTNNYFRQSVLDINANSDLLAISTYPFSKGRVENIPDNFLQTLASFSTHPLFIAETSWPSDYQNFTQQDQANYIHKLQKSADLAASKGKKISVINFVSLIDPDKNACNLLKITQPFIYWFCSLGLEDGRGQPKTAFEALKVWKQSL